MSKFNNKNALSQDHYFLRFLRDLCLKIALCYIRHVEQFPLFMSACIAIIGSYKFCVDDDLNYNEFHYYIDRKR